jgi:hypothetical protein
MIEQFLFGALLRWMLEIIHRYKGEQPLINFNNLINNIQRNTHGK